MQQGKQADDRLMRRKEVEEMVGLSCSSIYEGMKNGTFPGSIRIGKKGVRWRLSTIRNWMAAQEAAS